MALFTLKILIVYLLIAPIFNFLILSCFGNQLKITEGKKFTYYILATVIFPYVIIFFSEIILTPSIYTITFFKNWITLAGFHLDGIIQIDPLSQLMCLLITIVSSIVQVYSFYYLENDKNLLEFISYLSLFTFSMLLLVLSENFLIFFSAWELVGLASFLLIGFWSTRTEARKAGLKAIILNRVGDCALIGGLGLLYATSNSLNFEAIFSLANENSIIICLLLLIGCIAKSAQLGLHIWLLDAMEGPTPVSALLHAATMVTAGVYLIIRFSYLFSYSTPMSNFLAILSSLTLVFGATAAVAQNDLKKTIAYSTCSQLAYMFVASALAGYNQALFHLFTHGFFKALLFLSAGLIIHNMKDEQDLRKMGGLLNVFPVTYLFFLIGSFAIIGLPFFAGFFSKDGILELIFSATSNGSDMQLILFVYVLANLGIFFTTYYSLRLLYYVFFNQPNGYKTYFKNIGYSSYPFGEAPTLILFCLSVLAVGSIVVGYLFRDLFIGTGSLFLAFPGFLKADSDFFFLIESIAYIKNIKLLPLLIIGFCFLVYGILATEPRNKIGRKIFRLFQTGYFYNYLVLQNSKKIVKEFFYFFLVEKAAVEYYGPYGLSQQLWQQSNTLNFLHTKKNFMNYIISSLLAISLTIFVLIF